jgi:hypothetical protein
MMTYEKGGGSGALDADAVNQMDTAAVEHKEDSGEKETQLDTTETKDK